MLLKDKEAEKRPPGKAVFFGQGSEKKSLSCKRVDGKDGLRESITCLLLPQEGVKETPLGPSL